MITRPVDSTAFGEGYVLEVTPNNPISSPRELVDVTNEIVGGGHAGVIAFTRDTVADTVREQGGILSNELATAGWHTHPDLDSIVIASEKRSSVATELVEYESGIRSVLASIQTGFEWLSLVSNLVPPFSIDTHEILHISRSEIAEMTVDQIQTGVLRSKEVSVIDHLNKIILDFQKGDSWHVSYALDRFRFLLRTLIDMPEDGNFRRVRLNTTARELLKISKNSLCEDRVLKLSQETYDAYVIPAGVIHARESIEARPDREVGATLGIDSKTRELRVGV